jgi:hypothetical protein
MGNLLRSGFAVLVAYFVVAPQQVAAHFDTPQFHTVKAELVAEHPTEKLWQGVKAWVVGAPRAASREPDFALDNPAMR